MDYLVELTKKNLELALIKLKSAEYNPGVVVQLCREFDLNWERINEMWLYKRNIELFKEKLREYYG